MLHRSELTIAGMFAVHAKHAVFAALGGVEGVVSADVELGRAIVEHDARVTVDALAGAIAAAGFEVVASRALPRTLPTL